MKSYICRFIGRPWMPWSAYPWRPMSNAERRARWAMLYRAQEEPWKEARDE